MYNMKSLMMYKTKKMIGCQKNEKKFALLAYTYVSASSLEKDNFENSIIPRHISQKISLIFISCVLFFFKEIIETQKTRYNKSPGINAEKI